MTEPYWHMGSGWAMVTALGTVALSVLAFQEYRKRVRNERAAEATEHESEIRAEVIAEQVALKQREDFEAMKGTLSAIQRDAVTRASFAAHCQDDLAQFAALTRRLDEILSAVRRTPAKRS